MLETIAIIESGDIANAHNAELISLGTINIRPIRRFDNETMKSVALQLDGYGVIIVWGLYAIVWWKSLRVETYKTTWILLASWEFKCILLIILYV